MNPEEFDALHKRLESIERQLQLQNSVLKLAYRVELEREAQQVLDDPACSAVLAESTAPISAGLLKKTAQKASGQSAATVERRISDLVERGLLERSGSGSRVTYQSTGLVNP